MSKSICINCTFNSKLKYKDLLDAQIKSKFKCTKLSLDTTLIEVEQCDNFISKMNLNEGG